MTNFLPALHAFLKVAENDERLGPTHLCLYLVLLLDWTEGEERNPVEINRKTVMKKAKIYSRSTYSICINGLHKFGYLIYAPSMDPAVKSRVYINWKG